MRNRPVPASLGILLLLALVLVGVPAEALLWMAAVPDRSFEGPLPPLTPAQRLLAQRLEGHVRAIAAKPHNSAFPRDLEQAALHIEGLLRAMGYVVNRQAFFASGERVRNIEVVVEDGGSERPTLVVGAHYDSAGLAPGANDNGTGTAAALELARSLADLRGKAPCRIRLVLFVNEEPPFFQTEKMGSLVYARQLKRAGRPSAP